MDIAGIRNTIKENISLLTPREIRILDLRFGVSDGRRRTLQDAADCLNVEGYWNVEGYLSRITRERVRLIEKQALKKIGLYDILAGAF